MGVGVEAQATQEARFRGDKGEWGGKKVGEKRGVGGIQLGEDEG